MGIVKDEDDVEKLSREYIYRIERKSGFFVLLRNFSKCQVFFSGCFRELSGMNIRFYCFLMVQMEIKGWEYAQFSFIVILI